MRRIGNDFDGFLSRYNFTDFHELNLDWLIVKMIELNEIVENFVSLNTIKYADPIQWNISTQYEANTVVVDPATGTAYLSTKPVPSGVALSNPDYWTVIFDLDVAQANNNITLRDDGNNVLSTFTSDAGDWLLWNGTLYKVTQTIGLSQAYVPGYNIERYTVELFVREYISALETIIGNLSDLTTTDKTNLVNAINEIKTSMTAVESKLSNVDWLNVKDFGAVGDGVTDDTQAIQEALDTGLNIYLPTGNYLISSTLKARWNTNFFGAGCDSSRIFRVKNMTGHTIQFGDLTTDTPYSAGACKIAHLTFYRRACNETENMSMIPDNATPYDLVGGTYAHIDIEGGQNFEVFDCLIGGMPIGIDIIRSDVGHIHHNNIGNGIYGNGINGIAISDGVAGVRIGELKSGLASQYTQLIEINSNRFYGASTENKYTRTVGNGTALVNGAVGGHHDILVKCCEGLNIHSNYLGGGAFTCLGIYPEDICMNFKIRGNFFDPAGMYCIEVNQLNAGKSVIEMVIDDNIFNGQGDGLAAFSFQKAFADAFYPVYNLIISNNTFDNFLACCGAVNNAKGVIVEGNNFTNYNCSNCNDSTNPYYSCGLFIGSCENLETHDNNYGGGINTLDNVAYHYFGVYHQAIVPSCVSYNEHSIDVSLRLVANNGGYKGKYTSANTLMNIGTSLAVIDTVVNAIPRVTLGANAITIQDMCEYKIKSIFTLTATTNTHVNIELRDSSNTTINAVDVNIPTGTFSVSIEDIINSNGSYYYYAFTTDQPITNSINTEVIKM